MGAYAGIKILRTQPPKEFTKLKIRMPDRFFAIKKTIETINKNQQPNEKTKFGILGK